MGCRLKQHNYICVLGTSFPDLVFEALLRMTMVTADEIELVSELSYFLSDTAVAECSSPTPSHCHTKQSRHLELLPVPRHGYSQ